MVRYPISTTIPQRQGAWTMSVQVEQFLPPKLYVGFLVIVVVLLTAQWMREKRTDI
jgi:hypothetical protein